MIQNQVTKNSIEGWTTAITEHFNVDDQAILNNSSSWEAHTKSVNYYLTKVLAAYAFRRGKEKDVIFLRYGRFSSSLRSIKNFFFIFLGKLFSEKRCQQECKL